MAETTDDRLRLLIERVERLEEEKKGIADDIRDVYMEAKAVGYDAKIMRQVVRLRKMQPDDRKEMEAIKDPKEQKEFFDKMVARSYEHGKAANMASFLEIDQVIDPLETRRWIKRGLASLPHPAHVEGKRRPFIDTW